MTNRLEANEKFYPQVWTRNFIKNGELYQAWKQKSNVFILGSLRSSGYIVVMWTINSLGYKILFPKYIDVDEKLHHTGRFYMKLHSTDSRDSKLTNYYLTYNDGKFWGRFIRLILYFKSLLRIIYLLLASLIGCPRSGHSTITSVKRTETIQFFACVWIWLFHITYQKTGLSSG